VPALNGSGSLVLGVAPPVLDLDEARMRGNLPVKKGFDFAVETGTVKALVALNIAKESGVISAATGAGGARSGGGVEGGVFAVEWRIRKRQVQIGLYPCGKVLRGQ
jgi:hypothetical protein